MTDKLTPAQSRDLLAAAEAGGTHPGTTHGPATALVERGLAVEIRPAEGGYAFDLTTAGWEAAKGLGFEPPATPPAEAPAAEAPAPAKPTVEQFDACPRCGFAFKTPQAECRVRSACDKRAAARTAASA